MYVNQPIREKKKKFRWWKIPLILIAVVLAAAIIYVAYVMISYNRIDDNTELTGASTATISRVKKCLVYGNGGYRDALGKLKKKGRLCYGSADDSKKR